MFFGLLGAEVPVRVLNVGVVYPLPNREFPFPNMLSANVDLKAAFPVFVGVGRRLSGKGPNTFALRLLEAVEEEEDGTEEEAEEDGTEEEEGGVAGPSAS